MILFGLLFIYVSTIFLTRYLLRRIITDSSRFQNLPYIAPPVYMAAFVLSGIVVVFINGFLDQSMYGDGLGFLPLIFLAPFITIGVFVFTYNMAHKDLIRYANSQSVDKQTGYAVGMLIATCFILGAVFSTFLTVVSGLFG